MRRWAGQPLLGTRPGGRRLAWALLGACVVVVFGLGSAFGHQSTPDGLDRLLDTPVIDALGGHPALLDLMQSPGTQVPAVVLSGAMAIGCLWRRRLNGALLALLAVPVATELVELLLKPLFYRLAHGAASYPSGHTTSVVSMIAVYVVLFMAGQADVRYKKWRVTGLIILLVLAVITAVGLIGLEWHYFTDTVGGAAVAVGTVCALCLLLDWVWQWPEKGWISRADRPQAEHPGSRGRARSSR
jgi:membrane-associated phospholipid phosphatase